MSEVGDKSYAALERGLVDAREAGAQVQRKLSLLTAIVRIFRETLECETEEDVAQLGLKIAEELTGSAIGFIGELNQQHRFDTTLLSAAGWAACQIPRDQAVELLSNMPNRGINRIGLQEGGAWIVNDPANHPDRVEKPEGHPPITAFLGVPLRYVGGTTGMIALANKAGGYTEADLQDVEAFSVAFTEALNRRRAEREIGTLNQQLALHLQQAEEANKELEAFSYTVSHDLRAPLRHITGFVELLNKRDLSALDDKSRHYLRVISESAQKMGNLIDDLLAFSRMGRTELQHRGVDLARMAREIVTELEGTEARGRRVDWVIGELPSVAGDAAMLHQVLFNLLANALKFTRTRDVARIEVGAEPEPDAEGLVRLYVRDNGIGFDPRYIHKLFGLFQRLHDQEEFEGTGVGLASVRRIVHRHGGRTWADGKPGEGATFWFVLPAAHKEE